MNDNTQIDIRSLVEADSFRDNLSTVTTDGKRKWIFPVKPGGKWFNYRAAVAVFFYAIFFITPFIKVHGRPFLQFNFPEGKFILFSYAFWPKDFFIFGLLMLAAIVFIALFTNAFGRIFCGWICPQTIFMEMLFRRVDYLVLGSAQNQRLLARAPWDSRKVRKYSLRYVLYFILSFIIANTFLSYIIGVDQLFIIMTEPVFDHLGGFLAILIFTIVFFCVYAFLREQVCTNICPYGRLQSVLLDKNSVVVAYDYKRGEPRAKFRKNQSESDGDCIDCNACVNVCPTGIDIRNGTQLECVNCTACIDACNFMMEKTGRPKGLIRFDSENNIAEGKKFRFNAKLKGYTAVLIVLIAAIVALLITRKNIDGTLMRTSGMLYQERGTDSITNLYNLKLINKSIKGYTLELKPDNFTGRVELVGNNHIKVEGEQQVNATLFIVRDKKSIHERKEKLKIGLYFKGEKVNTMGSTFLGPVQDENED
jgi:cytochrome c oxidase accessory protein FixG